MEKLLISSKLFVTCKSVINFSSLRLDNSTPITIGLELVFVNLCSTISENLLFLSFQENPDLLIF